MKRLQLCGGEPHNRAKTTSKHVEKHRFTVQNYVFSSNMYCDIDCEEV